MILEDAATQAYAVEPVAVADATANLDDRSAERVVKAGGNLACRPVPGNLFRDRRDGLTKIHHNRFTLLQIELVALRNPWIRRHLQRNGCLPFEGNLRTHSRYCRYRVEQPPARRGLHGLNAAREHCVHKFELRGWNFAEARD